MENTSENILKIGQHV